MVDNVTQLCTLAPDSSISSSDMFAYCSLWIRASPTVLITAALLRYKVYPLCFYI